MWIDDLKFKQECHRKVKIAVSAWSKKTAATEQLKTLTYKDADGIERQKKVGAAETMRTSQISGKGIIKKLIINRAKSLAFRYDIETNDQDRSINELCNTKGGGMDWVPSLPLVLYYTVEDKVLIFHVISEDLAFVSAVNEELIIAFLGSLGE